jgi:hypothetical protein
MIDYENPLCPPHLSLADRMSISLKENLDRVMNELDSSLSEMELLYHAVHEVLVALCQPSMTPRGYSGELQRGITHVQDTYFALLAEVKGMSVWIYLQ